MYEDDEMAGVEDEEEVEDEVEEEADYTNTLHHRMQPDHQAQEARDAAC